MSRRRLLCTCLAMCGLLGLAVALLTPWHPLGTGGGVVRPDVNAAFTAGEIARGAGFRSALGPWPYVGIALAVAVPWGLLAFFSRSAPSPESSSVIHGFRRFALILAVVVGVAALQWAAAAPASVHSEVVLRRFGLSTQSNEYQTEMACRLHLPFPVLSDEKLALTRALNLPTMEVAGFTLIRRLALIIDDARITQVFYPVFPPDRNASDVLAWLKENRV